MPRALRGLARRGNGEAFALGDYVRSGSEVLQCAERGVWVRKAESRPD
jgi:hypothetical protein